MAKFSKVFFDVISEARMEDDLAATIESGLDGSPQGDDSPEVNAMKSELDKGTNPDDYLTDPLIDKNIQDQIEQRNQELASVLIGWANKIDGFVEFLNGQDENSIQFILSKAQPGTLLAKVQSTVNRKLANNASELAATAEVIRSFAAQKAISAQ